MPDLKEKGIIAWFAYNPVAANLLMIFILLLGLYSVFTVRTELIPQEHSNTFTVTIAYPSASPEEVEKGITLKVEDAINDLTGIKTIKSTSSFGLSVVNVEVLGGYEREELLDEVKTIISGLTSLPQGTEKPIYRKFQHTEPAIQLQLYGDLSEKQAKLLAEEIKNELMATTLVKKVNVWGTRPYELAVEIDERTLQKYQLSLADVANKIKAESLNAPGGVLKTGSGTVLLKVEGQSYTTEEFESIPLLVDESGAILTLGEIAIVHDGFVEWGAHSYFDGQYSIGLSVVAVGDQDLLKVAEAARDYIAEKQKELPEGVHLTDWADTSFYLEGRLNMMGKNLAMGGILVFLVLVLFVQPRIAFWVMMGIPVCYMGVFMLMPIESFEVSVNLVTLFALILVLGVIVDDAVIVAESVDREVRKNGFSVENVIRGTKRVAVPAIFGVLTTIAAFSPALFGEGAGHMKMYSIGFIVIVCLLFSLMESKWILPAHLAGRGVAPKEVNEDGLLGRIQKKFNGGLEHWVETSYSTFLDKAVKRRYLTMAVFVSMLIVVGAMVSSGVIKYLVFPPEPNDFLQVKLSMSEATPEEETNRAMEKIKQGLLDLEADYQQQYGDDHYIVKHLYRYGSGGLNGFFLVEMSKAEDREVDSFQIIEDWRRKVGEIEGSALLDFSAEIQGSSRNIAFSLVSDDDATLHAALKEVEQELRTFEGLSHFWVSTEQVRDELVLSLKPQAVALGLTLADIGLQVKEAFYGAEAQRFQRDNEDIKVIVRYPEEFRKSLKDLESMYIDVHGKQIPLTALAEYSLQPASASLARLDGNRIGTVRAKADRSVEEPDTIRKLMKNEFFPALFEKYPGVSFKQQGIDQDQEKIKKDLWRSLLIALAGIFILLAIPLKSYSQPLIIMSVIPFGFIGAALGHWFLGFPISFISQFGLIALTGVVVNDSLIMVDFVNRAVAEGKPYEEAVMDAGKKRFRAIVLTTLTTFVGVLPMMAETSLQAQNLIPMAISLGFGIVFATAITLVLLPCLYLILEDFKKVVGLRTKQSLVNAEG